MFHCNHRQRRADAAELPREMFAEAGFVSFDVHRVEGDIRNNYYVARVP